MGTVTRLEGTASHPTREDFLSDSGRNYVVSISASGEWQCSCPQWKFRRQPCKHICEVRGPGKPPLETGSMKRSVAVKPRQMGATDRDRLATAQAIRNCRRPNPKPEESWNCARGDHSDCRGRADFRDCTCGCHKPGGKVKFIFLDGEALTRYLGGGNSAMPGWLMLTTTRQNCGLIRQPQTENL